MVNLLKSACVFLIIQQEKKKGQPKSGENKKIRGNVAKGQKNACFSWTKVIIYYTKKYHVAIIPILAANFTRGYLASPGKDDAFPLPRRPKLGGTAPAAPLFGTIREAWFERKEKTKWKTKQNVFCACCW
jgi:hypothetical protein